MLTYGGTDRIDSGTTLGGYAQETLCVTTSNAVRRLEVLQRYRDMIANGRDCEDED